MELNELSRIALQCAFKVHADLGPGLLESAYEACTYYELCEAGLTVEKQKVLPVTYHNVKLDAGYRVDLLVEDSLILEIKAVKALDEVHFSQLLTYLKLADCKLGLLLNFNVKSLKLGIRRVVNGY